MDNLNVAIVILVIVILLYLSPATRSCITREASWLALVGGGLAVGLLLMAGPKRRGVAVSGGASGERRKGSAEKGPVATARRHQKKGAVATARRHHKRKGGAGHEEGLDEGGGEAVDVGTVEEIEAFLDEGGDALPGAARSDAAEGADLTAYGGGAGAPDSLGAYVADAPEPAAKEALE